ncbi:MAG: GNAT family N-acetyltransferase [Spirosomaceae bacterium]|jgi:hypothetical protein|nr:GNAT family N-acetyltransferase [Spirosomataceae bacterium]
MLTSTPRTLPLAAKYKTLVFENEPFVLHQLVAKSALWLFNTPEHVAQQSASTVLSFVLTDALTATELLGVLHLFLENDTTARSPFRAPFGSFDVAEGVSHEALQWWLTEIETYCRRLNVNRITIKHFPECYAPSRAVFVKRGLSRSGFEVTQSFENQYIEIQSASFESQLHPSERRRLRKCLNAGFRFEQCLSPDVSEVYHFIAQNRQSLGYRISFSQDDLQRWLTLFPDHFYVFWVIDGTRIASLTLAVRAGERVLYNFCPANSPDYRSYSPAVLLTAGLYDYCQHNQITVLDLGISLDNNGIAKPSLIRFKRNLGAKSCLKMVFEKQISPLLSKAKTMQ